MKVHKEQQRLQFGYRSEKISLSQISRQVPAKKGLMRPFRVCDLVERWLRCGL